MTPKELGDLADLYDDLREQRLAKDKESAALKERESAAYAAIIEELRRQEITSIGGQRVTLTLKESDEPTKEGWGKFWDYVVATGDESLIERRVNAAAVKEHWAAGETIPGIGKFTVYKLSKHKVKS